MTVRLSALGTTVDVDLSGSELDEAEFRRLWSRCSATKSPARAEANGPQTVTSPATLRLTARTYEGATQEITRAFIEQQRGRLLMLHAGAVSDPRTGNTLAFIAPGGTGKSTLTRLLGQQWGYVTDETVALSPETLEVFPYPKPVTWADVAGKPKREHAPEDLGLLPAPAHPRLTQLVVLRRTDGAPATMTRLDLLDALEMVVSETSSLSLLPRPLHLLTDVFARVGGVTLIEYGEAADIVGWCRQLLTAPPTPAAPDVRPVPEQGAPRPVEGPVSSKAGPGTVDGPSTGRRRPAQGPIGTSTLRLLPFVDLLTVDGESAVMQEDRLLRLGPIATAIVELLAQPHTLEQLADKLEARFGSPPDGSLATALNEQLRVLAEHHVIDWALPPASRPRCPLAGVSLHQRTQGHPSERTSEAGGSIEESPER